MMPLHSAPSSAFSWLVAASQLPAAKMAATMRCQAFTATPRPVAMVRAPRMRTMVISASYKNKENIDLSRAPAFAKHAQDSGSAEYQVALLTARVEQISKHLSTNKKDHAAKRGLVAILSQRKSLLQYLYRKDRAAYARLIETFKIRGVVSNDTRGAAREKEAVVQQAAA